MVSGNTKKLTGEITMQKKSSVAEALVKWFTYGMLIITVLIVGAAMFGSDTKGEASIGSFESWDFNDGWTLTSGETSEQITLPLIVDAQWGQYVFLRNTLPADIPDGSSLMMRSSLQDAYIYINGELREQYGADGLSTSFYYAPSAYIVTELSEEDSGAEVIIKLGIKDNGKLNTVTISRGNNGWFGIFRDNIAVNAVALVVLILGIILIPAALIMQHYTGSAKATFILGLMMIDLSIWVFSESKLRQLIFIRPSLSGYFTYLSVEMLGVMAMMFFDEMQHKIYHKRYIVLEALSCLQLAVNIVLHITHISEFHDTLIYAHLWMLCGLILTIINVVSDILTQRIKQYSVTAIGMVCFAAASLVELIIYYTTNSYVFGVFVCIGLVMLTVATVIQAMVDLISAAKEREEMQTKSVVSTIETIAGAIDAKDEYTGGHSERVGHYAAILARGMAAEYELSEEDILRIHYIGNMHDIGKIGVTDSILNKTGRLTDDEFCLMKKHVDIGAELMQGMSESIDGLIDGIHYHHERFDGRGYPEGLSETQIPLVARIICLADCYDAMTSNRVYRKRLSNEDVRAEFVKCSGTQFDPALTEIFIRLMDSGELVPYTVDGMAAAESGAVMRSALLENYLQKTSGNEETKAANPTHIRMLSYIMKLKEKKGERVEAFIISLPDNSAEALEKAKAQIKPFMHSEDIHIEYNDHKRMIALFNKTDEQIESFIKAVEECPVRLEIERI